MSSVTFADHPWLVPDRRLLPRYQPFRKGMRAAALAYAALFAVVLVDTHPAIGPGCEKHAVQHAVVKAFSLASAVVAPRPLSPLLDPTPAAGAVLHSFAETAPLAATFELASAPPSVVVADVEQDDDTAIPAAAVALPLVADVPLPTPRPADLAVTAHVAGLEPAPLARNSFRSAGRSFARRDGTAAAAPDDRSFFEKFFGIQPPQGTALAYATPEEGFFSSMRRAVGAPNPAMSYGPNTAVYEISAHTVYMPDGSRLEAHSGLRERLDDPRFVQERMRGPTPPSTYDLKLREAMFHGVQALRLTPIGGNVFGRTGLLAHTYMLGPNGDSNGCVSFRNYRAFLQAYLNGDVRRLVVVARIL